MTDYEKLLIRIRADRMIAQNADTVYTVYVQTNDDGYITAVNSDAFITDLSMWFRVDAGKGDLYHFAKNLYLPFGVQASDGSFNYKLVKGTAVYDPQHPVSPTPTIEERLSDLETAICELMDALS